MCRVDQKEMFTNVIIHSGSTLDAQGKSRLERVPLTELKTTASCIWAPSLNPGVRLSDAVAAASSCVPRTEEASSERLETNGSRSAGRYARCARCRGRSAGLWSPLDVEDGTVTPIDVVRQAQIVSPGGDRRGDIYGIALHEGRDGTGQIVSRIVGLVANLNGQIGSGKVRVRDAPHDALVRFHVPISGCVRDCDGCRSSSAFENLNRGRDRIYTGAEEQHGETHNDGQGSFDAFQVDDHGRAQFERGWGTSLP